MDPNTRMYSAMGSDLLGLEMSLHHDPQSQQHQNPQSVSFLGQNPHPQTGLYHTNDPNFRNPNRPLATKSKTHQFTISDEDEPGLGPDDSTSDGKRKLNSSPWQRMKWTDNMVRLLILVVYYIGDEAGPEGGDVAGKKKACTSGGGGGGGGMLLKKGKWKSVSRAMMEKGFCVSPQQCEDKFNDLNKRYKRVNDILGKGTACRVVENQGLLDTMDGLTAKKKDEVKKLLNSKHLFFREMCAYHTSCGGGGGSSGAHPEEPRRSECHHSSGRTAFGAFPDRKEADETRVAKRASGEEGMDDNEVEDEDDFDDEDDDEECSKKRKVVDSGLVQRFSGEVASVVQDVGKSFAEKKQWLKNRTMQLEEKRVEFQFEGFELEKQRLKWLKFSVKKERDMEREKLQNDRARLENERMLLFVRKKEFELLD